MILIKIAFFLFAALVFTNLFERADSILEWYSNDLIFLVRIIFVTTMIAAFIRIFRGRRIVDYMTGIRRIILVLIIPIALIPIQLSYTSNVWFENKILTETLVLFLIKVSFIILPLLCAIYLILLHRGSTELRDQGVISGTAGKKVYVALAFLLALSFSELLLEHETIFMHVNELFYRINSRSEINFFVIGELTECKNMKSCASKNNYLLPFVFLLSSTKVYIVMLYFMEVMNYYRLLKSEGSYVILSEGSLSRLSTFMALFFSTIIGLIFVGASPISVGLFSGLVGAGLSITFRDLLHNFAAGFVITLDKSIRRNNYVRINKDIKGIVSEMNFRYTTLLDRNSIEYIVPNSLFLSSIIENYSRSKADVRITIRFRVPSTVDVSVVGLKLKENMNTSPGRVISGQGKIPRLFYDGLEHGYHQFNYRFWINDPGNGIANIKSEVMVWIYESIGDDAKNMEIVPGIRVESSK